MERDTDETDQGPTRRSLIVGGVALASAAAGPLSQVPHVAQAAAQPAAAGAFDAGATMPVGLLVNGREHVVQLDPRVTLLDALREHLQLTGSKKGCDQGQCGACTVLIEGRRTLSCLTLAVMHDGDGITTIEGLGAPGRLHPIQAAFIERDGFQCGYCTPGQILSAAAVLDEIRGGIPSHVTQDLDAPIAFSDAEVRERMSGNICRCAAYPNIVAAIRDVHEAQG